jgi:hypothetical protein
MSEHVLVELLVAELDEHDVLLRRRGAPALRLTQADRMAGNR